MQYLHLRDKHIVKDDNIALRDFFEFVERVSVENCTLKFNYYYICICFFWVQLNVQ